MGTKIKLKNSTLVSLHFLKNIKTTGIPIRIGVEEEMLFLLRLSAQDKDMYEVLYV